MSDIFETDIDDENENLSSLEDNDIAESTSENLVFDYPLYHLKLDYSCETLYAKTPDNKMQIAAGDFVIVPTRYGKDMARVMASSFWFMVVTIILGSFGRTFALYFENICIVCETPWRFFVFTS